tara:strand:+ start:2684 stop:4438 length:1755 start_codon:yes stop_codon:yes gene_type:complete
MKISKLLNKKFFFLFSFLILISNNLNSNEPVDIWDLENIKKESTVETITDIQSTNIEMNSITNLDNSNLIGIEQDEKIESNQIKLVGLYDPAENDLNLNMWELSDGEKIINLSQKIQKVKLSDDAKNIYKKLILTNAFPPKTNISIDEFVDLKIKWLIKNDDLNLIKEFIIKNDQQTFNTEIIKHYLDKNLSLGKIDNACELFSFTKTLPVDKYVLKYKIYCLIHKDKKEIAQLQYDLIKETGYQDKFFDKGFNFLMGYTKNPEIKISEKNLLEFHLSHLITKNFIYEPNENTKKIIWQYLSSNNLLTNANDIDLNDREKIKSFEKATNDGSYKEADLLDLYTRFQFNIYQIISVFDAYKLLPNYEARALLYQAFLVSKDSDTQIRLLELLKKEFDNDNLSKAFDKELIKLILTIDEDQISSEFYEFYEIQLSKKQDEKLKIKYNNKILHQSKLINYFNGEASKEKVERDLDKMFKKIKKNKKYYFSTKDNILIESLISDGIKISEKYESMLELDKSNIPTDIEVMINDGEIAMILLRLVEIIGEDNLKDLGTETLYFIISTLNKLNIDKIRNDIILQVIPVKV